MDSSDLMTIKENKNYKLQKLLDEKKQRKSEESFKSVLMIFTNKNDRKKSNNVIPIITNV